MGTELHGSRERHCCIVPYLLVFNIVLMENCGGRAVMRMQGHPMGTGLTLEQKKTRLWGSKAVPDQAQVCAPSLLMS